MSTQLYKKLTQAQGKRFEHPIEIFEDIKSVYHNIILSYLDPSPLRKSIWLSELTGGEVWLKLESLNPNGSFKVRGALNALSEIIKQHKVTDGHPLKICAASAGNHAQGVAYACRELGCQAHIFLPKGAPMVKKDATEKLGAKIYVGGKNLEEAFECALAFAEKENAHFLHAYNNYDIIMGQSTCAYELILQYQQEKIYNKKKANLLELSLKQEYLSPDYFICSVGGGGLAAGSSLIFKALNLKTKVIGVQQEFYNSALRSLQNKMQLSTDKSKSTIADGIAVGLIGNLNYDYMEKYLEKITIVDDDSLVKSILMLCEKEHLVSEGAGAAAVAEILKNPSYFKGKTVVACVSGGNIDPQLLTRVIARGLHITDRVLRVSVCVNDKPGGLRNLLQFIAEMEGNVLDLIHDRTYSAVSVGDVDVELSLETRNSEHQYLLIEGLEEAGFKPRVRH
jgi:threonine dehydratase